MQYLGRTPPPLDRYVERIWYCSAPTLQSRERLLPGGGTLDLLVNLVDDEIRIYDAACSSIRALPARELRSLPQLR